MYISLAYIALLAHRYTNESSNFFFQNCHSFLYFEYGPFWSNKEKIFSYHLSFLLIYPTQVPKQESIKISRGSPPPSWWRHKTNSSPRIVNLKLTCSLYDVIYFKWSKEAGDLSYGLRFSFSGTFRCAMNIRHFKVNCSLTKIVTIKK